MKVNILAVNHCIIENSGRTYLQSYNSVIVCRNVSGKIELDEKYWDYSTATGKHRNAFLNETKKETQQKIDNGTYILTNLN